MRVYYEQSLLTFRAIYAFGQNDVWVGGNTQPMHWNGSQWQKYDVPATVFSAYIYKMWGTSSSNMIIVGTTGSIARFNGTTWQKTESGTTVDLEDVWGIDESHVWATGRRDFPGRSVVLQYDGRQWITLYDTETKPPEGQYGFNSVWTNNSRMLFLSGSGPSGKFHIATQLFRTDSGNQYFSYRIRGTSFVDVFVSGQGSEVLHYNGSNWYLYPEIKALAGDFTAGWLSIHAQKEFVVVGGLVLTGLTAAPVVLRGIR
jgi:hypothetical protein